MDLVITYQQSQRLIKQRRNIADALAIPDEADIDFDPPRVSINIRPTKFS